MGAESLNTGDTPHPWDLENRGRDQGRVWDSGTGSGWCSFNSPGGSSCFFVEVRGSSGCFHLRSYTQPGAHGVAGRQPGPRSSGQRGPWRDPEGWAKEGGVLRGTCQGPHTAAFRPVVIHPVPLQTAGTTTDGLELAYRADKLFIAPLTPPHLPAADPTLTNAQIVGRRTAVLGGHSVHLLVLWC